LKRIKLLSFLLVSIWISFAFSCKDPDNNDHNNDNSQDTTTTPPVQTVNRANVNFIWMSTQDPVLQSMIGASLEIRKVNGPTLFFMPDVRSETDVVFDWHPTLSCSVDTLYEFRLMDPGGNQVDFATFNPAEATDQDEFVVMSNKCTYFLQLSWYID
jgi:hypothetical protein